MNYTKEQIEKMADEYANQFMDGRDHFYGFKAGFEKALSLFAVSGRSEQLIDFAIKNGYIDDMPKGQKDGLIDKFEKSINCH